MTTVRRRLVARGSVQGVFFRDSSQQEARQRGLTGWVRNRDDGTVEIEVQGAEDDVDGFVRWAQDGPKDADVSSVDAAEQSPVEDESGFDVR